MVDKAFPKKKAKAKEAKAKEAKASEAPAKEAKAEEAPAKEAKAKEASAKDSGKAKKAKSEGHKHPKKLFPTGHFYNAKKCGDCKYTAMQCGCAQVTEYLACVTKFCHKATEKGFFDKCVAIENKCADDLDVQCHENAQCTGKFNQLPWGGIGLTLDLSGANKDAFCGPNGKCIGEMHMKANIHKPAEGVWLECGLPKTATDKNHIDKKEDWVKCYQEADKKAEASCDIPMFPELRDSAKGYCVLTKGKDGKKLTQPAWHLIKNVHKA